MAVLHALHEREPIWLVWPNFPKRRPFLVISDTGTFLSMAHGQDKTDGDNETWRMREGDLAYCFLNASDGYLVFYYDADEYSENQALEDHRHEGIIKSYWYGWLSFAIIEVGEE